MISLARVLHRGRHLAAALPLVAALALVATAAVHGVAPASAWARATPASADGGRADAKTAKAERDEAEEPEHTAPDSPRAAVTSFLAACRARRFVDAARYLDTPKGTAPEDAARLAEHLDVVLRHRLVLELDAISGLSTGDIADGLPATFDEIGRVSLREGQPAEPVRLTKRIDADGARWVFARTTVDRIDRWYAALDGRWIREAMPAALLRIGPRDIPLWQWLSMPLAAAVALLLGSLLERTSRPLFGRLLPERAAMDRARIAAMLTAPARLGWALLVFAGVVPWIGLDKAALDVLSTGFAVAIPLTVAWAAVGVVDMGVAAATGIPSATVSPGRAAAFQLGGKVAKIAVWAMAGIAVVSSLGYAVGSILAGMGIGGLALALAAQKTVENLFGAASIGFDQPFRIGDFIAFEGVKGTVVSLGLRSTRVRTLDRTLLTIPNGKLADMRIENISARDRYRLAFVLPLSRATPPSAVRSLLRRLEGLLLSSEGVAPADLEVNVKEVTKESIDVEITATFSSRDWNAFRALRNTTLLRLLDATAIEGVALARPTIAVVPHQEEDPPRSPAATLEGL